MYEKISVALLLFAGACATDDDNAVEKEREQREEQAERRQEKGDAKELGRDLEKAGDDVGDAVKDAGEDVKDAAKDAGSAVAEGVKEVGEDLSDAAVTARVKAALAHDEDLDDARIDVATENGVVTLTGSAASLGDKMHATSVARVIKGVDRVENKVEIH